MTKSAQAFRSIGEVARLIGVAPHVLRYWESQFPQLSPVKRADGRRYYRPADVLLAAGLCEKLREEGLTIRGAKRLLSQDRGASIRAHGAERLGITLDDTGAAPPPARRKAVAAAELPWLSRLSATAAFLRRNDAPAPDGLQTIAAQLRGLVD